MQKFLNQKIKSNILSKKLALNNFILLILLSSIWGSAFIAIKISVEQIHPISVASLRRIIGAIVLYIYFQFKNLKFNLSTEIIVLIFFIGLIGNFIPFALIAQESKHEITWNSNFLFESNGLNKNFLNHILYGR